ncbi:hypothetical protein GCM10023186_26200 [Hymenobacter koreensis]|uniref:LamG-like jellyroll fold domain-containing protein n=1 Tax=Hymenobacter koreensis TaxID=1084523 RepID=A0ABP8J3W3_9BACT
MSSHAQRGGNFLGFTSTEADQVTVNNFSLPATGPFSLEAWVYFNGNSFSARGTYNTVMEFGNDSPWFGVNSSGEVEFYPSLEGGTVPIRTWSHIAYTWDGATGTIYLNGTAVGTSTAAPGRTGTELGIGFNSGDTGWQGYIDEVMVWSTARTAAQIQSDRNTAPPSNSPGLMAYFKFDEGSGQTVANQVASGPIGLLGTTNAVETNDPLRTNAVVNSARNHAVATGQLQPNYPNPFSGSTTIPFVLRQNGHVRLTLTDLTGRAVATLLDEKRAAGSYTLPFTAPNLRSGIYLCQLTINGETVTQRLAVR